MFESVLLEFTLVVDNDTTLHGVHAYTVAFSPSVLIECGICSYHQTLTRTPQEWLKKAIHGIWHIVILFHHFCVFFFLSLVFFLFSFVCGFVFASLKKNSVFFWVVPLFLVSLLSFIFHIFLILSQYCLFLYELIITCHNFFDNLWQLMIPYHQLS